MPKLIRPFGPSILMDEVSSELVEILNRAGDRVLADPELSNRWDWSHMLAGNVHREIQVVLTSVEERNRVRDELKKKCILYYDMLLQQGTVMRLGAERDMKRAIGPEDLEFKGLWMVSQKAGDFNPFHSHGGDFSSVVYLRLPPGLEEEWNNEDHLPSVGAIEFFDGRPSPFSQSNCMIRPKVGTLLMFPSWLPHTVYPFRSEGERRSVSFNMAITPRKRQEVTSDSAMSESAMSVA